MDDRQLFTLLEAVRDGDDAPGLAAMLEPPAGGSLRVAAAWLPNGAVTLVAKRASGARGQDADEIAVIIAGELAAPGTQVFDPRLSTTYDAEGTPRRFGLELWLGEDEEGEQHPVRVGGELTEQSRTSDGVTVHRGVARSGAGEGTGVYLLVAAP
jgi:hypothetical protein